MKRFAVSLVAIFCVVLMAAYAQAGILSKYLTYDGVADLVQDDSVGLFSGDLTDPQVGDVLQGIFQVPKIGGKPIMDGTLFGIYSMQVTSAFTSDGKAAAAFGPIAYSGSGDNSIKGIMQALGLSPPPTPRAGDLNTDAVIMLVEKEGEIASIPNRDVGESFVDALKKVIDSTWTVAMVLGIVDSDDFHHIRVEFTSPSFGATYLGAYTVIQDYFGTSPNFQYLPVSSQDFDSVVHYGDVATGGDNSVNAPPPLGSPEGWMFSDDGSFLVNATPEPATLAVWGVLAGCGLMLYRRRRG